MTLGKGGRSNGAGSYNWARVAFAKCKKGAERQNKDFGQRTRETRFIQFVYGPEDLFDARTEATNPGVAIFLNKREERSFRKIRRPTVSDVKINGVQHLPLTPSWRAQLHPRERASQGKL